MDWLLSPLGLSVSGGIVGIIVLIIPILLKRIKTVGWGYSGVGFLFKAFMAFDVPGISGSSEDKLKDRIWSTFSDILMGVWIRSVRKRMAKPKDMNKLIKQIDKFCSDVIRNPNI